MTIAPPPADLRFRIGCPLALVLTAALIAGLQILVIDRPFRAGGLWADPLFVGLIGLPFAALAVAKARDLVAWLIAVGLTAAAWTWVLYPRGVGVNFGLALFIWLPPLVITPACLSIAGMRGRIAWAREGEASEET